MKIKSLLSLYSLICLSLCSTYSFAFGIDKLSASLDVGANFKSIESLTIFNDSGDEAVYVTAEGLKWSMDKTGQLLTSPTEDIRIYPSVIRVPIGGNTTFKIRYAGLPPVGEASYRILFRELRIPQLLGDNKDLDISTLTDSEVSVGTSITVPLYVADFTKKTDILEHIFATLNVKDKVTHLIVSNNGDRHITVSDYRINGKPSGKGSGIVLANLERIVPLGTTLPGDHIEVKINDKDQSKWIDAAARP